MRLALAMLVVVPSVLAAQRGGQSQVRTCNLVIGGGGSSFSLQTSPGKYTHWFSGGFEARCRGTTMIVTSDSAEHVEQTGVLTLVGRARYREDSTQIDANLMRYTQFDDRIVAEGNVRQRSGSGSTLTADRVEYLRANPPTRPLRSANARGNVHLVMRDSASVPDSLTTRIDADRLYMARDSLFYAGGNVTITRPEVIAKADSAETNSESYTARLFGRRPSVEGRGETLFTIEGNQIEVFGQGQRLQRLLAKGNAVAVSDSLRLSADTLDLRTTGDVLERVLAWGPGRARALSPARDIEADRLELVMPGQRMRDLFAYGRAMANTQPDSAVNSDDRDRIAGDTLIAAFDTLAVVRDAEQPPIRSLVAIGNASALFQIAPENPRDTLPTVNYVTGRRIDMAFVESAVRDVQVTGQVRGINLTPGRADSVAAIGGRIPPSQRPPVQHPLLQHPLSQLPPSPLPRPDARE